MASATTAERARRLIALMSHLRRNSVYDIDSLARSLGTEPSALANDLELLSMCGIDELDPSTLVPVLVEAGRLEVYGDLPALRAPVRLAPAEAGALASALQAAGLGSSDPLVAKIIAATSAGFDAATFERTLRAAVTTHEHHVFTTLADAIQGRHVVEIEYATADSDTTRTRIIEPSQLVAERGVWYLSAFCRRADAWRTFRLDRIRAAACCTESFVEHSDTPRALAFDDQGLPRATLRFTADSEYSAREWPGSRVAERGDDGTLVVEVPFGGTAWIARRVVARLGTVEVLAPDQVRAAVQQLALAELAAP